MLHVVVLDGPFAGRVRSAAEVDAAGVSPSEILGDFVTHGYRWRIVWPPAPGVGDAAVRTWLQQQLAAFSDEHGLDLTGRITLAEERPSDEDIAAWAQADLVCRIYAAAARQRGIRFGGQHWVLPDAQEKPGEFDAKLGALEEAIAAYGSVAVATDDGHGELVLDAVG
ncbi:hypothetical protein FHX42_005163 [Saccharopolyspora lacisalsi]|uniref:Uncharacterized protein n=1 Tax=Halosaccharopolyspora lacisalsi TaxID=1000566 RepID=A0A839E558_9PSEU|nr:hypothetical protein [Halosaccharopolyspora lacisalsi]MBA8827756.1 hypothetical protein [Halosaccharopolyspora lacisalsi]